MAELDGFDALAAHEEEQAMLLVPAVIPAVIPAVPAAEGTVFHVLSGDAVHHLSVGIHGLESARTGRSKCFFCRNTIREREMRFKYVPELKKPTRWIHRDCAHNMPATNRPSSVCFLRQWLTSPAASDTELAEAVADICFQLQAYSMLHDCDLG